MLVCFRRPAVTDRSRFSITPIGSLHTGWALKVDRILRRSSPILISLGAYVDAIMAGADEADGPCSLQSRACCF